MSRRTSAPHAPPEGVVRVGLVQSACGDDREANVARAVAGIAAAARDGARRGRAAARNALAS